RERGNDTALSLAPPHPCPLPNGEGVRAPVVEGGAGKGAACLPLPPGEGRGGRGEGAQNTECVRQPRDSMRYAFHLPAITLLFAVPALAAPTVQVFPDTVNLETSRDRQSVVVQLVQDDGITRDVTADAQ